MKNFSRKIKPHKKLALQKTLMGFSAPKSRGTGEPYFQQGNPLDEI